MNLNQGVNVYKLFFLIVMLTCYLNATDIMKSGHEAGKWSMDFQAISKYAKENDKAILINFTGSDWCGWCQMMHKGVFADNAWSKFAKDNLSLAYIDFPRDKSKVPIAYQQSNEELKQRFQVQGYPTYVLLSSDGTQVLGRLGASRGADASTFISKVKNLLPQKEGKLPDFTLLEHQNEEVDSLNEKLLSFINADQFTRNIVYEDTYDKLKSLLQKDPILLSTLNGKGIVELMIYGDLNKIKEMTDLIKKSVESGAPEDSLYKEFNLLVDDNDLDSLFKCMSFYAAFGQREKAISFLPPLDRLKEAQTIEEVSPWIALLKTVNTQSYLDLCFAVQQKDIASKDKIEMVKNIANHCANADESFMDLWFSDLVKSDELVQALKSYFDSKIQSIQKSKNYNQRATDLASNMRVFNRMSEIKVSPQLSRTALRYWQLEYAFTLMEQRKEKPQPPSMNNRPNNRRPPKFVPFVTIAENAPSVKTLSGLSYAEQELFAFQYAVADLKKGEYNANSFDRLLSFKDQYPKTVAQLCSEIFITWAQKANPNKTNQSRMIQSRGQVFRTEPRGIPLTRMRQEQNLKACKEMVAKAYQAGIEVDDEAVVRAFTSCFSQAEIVDESDVRLVFGDLSPYSDKLVLELCKRLVDMIERDWTNDKNNRRIQQQFMTNRTEIQIQEETVRAYNAVINLLDERLKNGGKSIHLTVILAGTYFDLAEYRRKKNLSTPEEQAKLRNEAFANLRACTKLYEEMLRDRKTDYTISPFSNWFSIILGASQIQNLKVTAAISDAYLEELKEQMQNMDEEWRDRHLDMLGNWMQNTWPKLQPHVKLPFMESALYVLEDHPSLDGLKKQMDFYQSLLTEVELNLTIDGSSDIGHQNEFGVFISLHHSRELGREAGGFDKYSMSNVNINGRGVVNYRKRFSEQLNKVLKDKFELGSLTWIQSRPKPINLSKIHWQKTPLAYMTLRAIDPAIDKFPEVKIEMDFNDGHGQVVLPVYSNTLYINAESPNYITRPNKETKVDMILDSRGVAEGKISLEIEVKGQGLMPDLGAFLKVPAEYQLGIKNAQPLVSRYEQDGDDLIVYSELSLDIPVKWQGDLDKFIFPELDYDVSEIKFKKYRDADIVAAEKIEYIKAVAARSPAVYVAIALFVILLGIGAMLLLGKSAVETDFVENTIIDPPQRISPVSVAAWLQDLANQGFDQDQALEDKQKIEQSYFSDGDSEDIDLNSVVKKWCDKQKRG